LLFIHTSVYICVMTAQEVFKEITNKPKWYVGYTTPQNASNIKRRFDAKSLEFETLQNMFNHFGYYLNASWNKVQSKS
jgi:hypothetical protein